MADRSDAIERAVAELSKQLERSVSRGIDQALRQLEGAEQLEQIAILNQLPDALVEAGLQDVSERLEELFADELSAIRTDFAQRLKSEVVFSGIDATLIETLLEGVESSVFQTVRDLGLDVQSELVRQVITGQRLNLDPFVDVVPPRVFRNLATELETATSSFSRAVTARKADELGFDLFVYLGVNDKVTRPFCDFLLGDSAKLPARAYIPIQRQSNVYTREEIQQMRNGQGLDVLTFCGGWNCRHQWRPITKEDADRRGFPS